MPYVREPANPGAPAALPLHPCDGRTRRYLVMMLFIHVTSLPVLLAGLCPPCRLGLEPSSRSTSQKNSYDSGCGLVGILSFLIWPPLIQVFFLIGNEPGAVKIDFAN
jgi:hypothetical protein